MSLGDLAYRIGVQPVALGEWEKGRRFPASVGAAIRWAKELRISLADLADLLKAGYNPRYRSKKEQEKLAGALADLKCLPVRAEDICRSERSYRDRNDRSPMYRLRAAKQWTEGYVIACLECSPTAYRNWERGDFLPEILFLVKAAELFEVDAEELHFELAKYKEIHFPHKVTNKGGLVNVAA